MDPIGNVPVFLALTPDRTAAQRRRAAVEACLVAGGVVFAFAAFGQAILHLLHISLASLEVAGGMVLVVEALSLLSPNPRPVGDAARSVNVAYVPLGTPLLAGPGAIAAVMVYIQRTGTASQVFIVLAAVTGVLIVTFLALTFANQLGRLLKENGIELLSRIVGLLLAAIAVQLMATGAYYWATHGV
jgi:multiple antibiotic resistance protein